VPFDPPEDYNSRMRPEISPRGLAMPASPIRRLMPVADEAKRRGVHVYHLNIGQPDIETPAAFRSKLAHVDRVLAYTPSGGTTEYLEALRIYYRGVGIELAMSELLATTAGSEALLSVSGQLAIVGLRSGRQLSYSAAGSQCPDILPGGIEVSYPSAGGTVVTQAMTP